jgi:hypothetical protein
MPDTENITHLDPASPDDIVKAERNLRSLFSNAANQMYDFITNPYGTSRD